MAAANTRIYIDNNPADEQVMGYIGEIKVDQAIGMATEAELHMSIGADRTGRWSGMEEDFVQPLKRVRVEVKIRNSDYVPLIDGVIIGQNFELSTTPNSSKMVMVVQDDSILLNQDEGVELFENKSPDEIARQLFQQYGLTPDTDSVAVPAGGLDRFLVRRGTAMQFLLELARRHGMFVYVEPDDIPGSSKGVFRNPDLSSGEYPDLQLMGPKHNINNFTVQFDGLRPLKARAGNVDITNQNIVTSDADSSNIDPQGGTAVHDMLQAGQTILARTREETTDLDSATAAAVNHSSWAYSANAEVIADNYSGVLLPYRVIKVRGTGGYISGEWLISQVAHTINDSEYKQSFTLRRNARSDGADSMRTGLGGVF